MRQADEQNGSDAERKSADTDLADQVAETDGKKRRQNRLGPDDVAGKIDHDSISWNEGKLVDLRKDRLSGRGSPLYGIVRSRD